MKSSFPGNSKKINELRLTLERTLGQITNKRRAVMFSGGFDSMLLVLLAQRKGARVTAVTVRFADFNPRTVAAASLLARRMELPHHIIHVTLPEFLAAFGSFRKLTDKPLSDFDLVLVHAAFNKYDPRIAGKIFVSGMGGDQWLGDDAVGRSAIDENIHHKLAQAHGYKFIFPFLSGPVLALAQKIPAALKNDKKLLRGLVTKADIAMLPSRGVRREIQVPMQVRQLLARIYAVSGSNNFFQYGSNGFFAV